MSHIVLDIEHRRSIAKRGEAAYPLACRGLLLGYRNGKARHVVDIVCNEEPIRLESPESRYIIPYQEMQAGEEMAKTRGLEVIGAFHSCVDLPAKPSAHDSQFVQPTFCYVLVGIREGRAHELTAWKVSEDRTAFFQDVLRSS
jgi:proteasome lid subunit RPN8/RPN11